MRYNALTTLLAATLLSVAPSAMAQIPLPFHPAQRADDFVETIGVATHWGYSDTPYGYAYENVKALLAASGIRYVRDDYHPQLDDLFANHGIRTTMLFNPRDTEQTLATIKAHRDLIAMIEGPNEVALFSQSASYKGKGFPEGPRLWMNDLYKAVKADLSVRAIPIIAPSTGRSGANASMAPLTTFDYNVMHSYAGGGTPSSSLYAEMNNNIADAYSILGDGAIVKPLVVTESGYHTALGNNVVIGGAQSGVSERAQAKYLPRHFAEYFNAGIVRTHTYEFIDSFADYKKDEREATNAEACFGMVKHDLTPKPAYTAVKNLISLLAEAHWDTVAGKWQRPSPDFVPRALPLTLTGTTANVHHTLLQKADGDYYLLLWQEVSSFDLPKREDLSPPEAEVTLSIANPATLTIYRPGSGVTPVRRADTKATSLTLGVPDEVVIVRISAYPSIPVAPATAVVRPSGFRANATASGNQATVSFNATDKDRPAGIFVYRVGKLVANITAPKQRSFTDEGLLPGKVYPYQIVTCDSSGRLAPPISLFVTTKSEYADLIVTEVGFEEKPTPGQPVKLKAKIKNIGNAPTPEKITHGVAFSVDGQFIAWSDTFTGPLKPGESKEVVSNNGPKGVPHWVAVSGMHKLSATVDDVRRIPEKTHDNNTLEATVTVP